MIAKHIAMQSAKRSSFAGLAAYITSAHSKGERVGEVRMTNFANDDVAMAVIEAEVTQRRNTLAKGDKTYHLVLSFRPGEQPTTAVLIAAEKAICDGLGFGEHQRISAVHHDTDNVHIHIAINKVHPTRHTLHEPYLAYRRIGEICAQVERDHGLEVDNHQGAKRAGENRADDMAEASGIEPLRDWIRRTCLEDLRAAPTWEALHAVAAANGLTLCERGAGLILGDANGVTIKPSTVARELGRATLETRLGKFGPGPDAPPGQERARYEKRPVPTRIDTAALYARYRREDGAAREVRTASLDAARRKRDAAIEAAKRWGRLERAAIKLSGQGRRVSYEFSSRKLRAAVDTARQQFDRDQEAIGRATRPKTWADWLQAQAQHGDTDALAALRARGKGDKRPGTGVAVAGTLTTSDGVVGAVKIDSVTKHGTIIFHSPGAAIRDDGARVSVSRGADVAGIVAALQVARARYGETLDIEGSAEFRARVAKVAAAVDPSIRFRDADLERQRAAFAKQWKELTNERSNTERRGPAERRRVGGDRAGNAEPRRTGSRRADAVVRRPPVARVGQLAAVGASGKPDVSRVGQGPPPERQNRLRAMSELGVVRIDVGPSVLLPRDVHDELEHARTQPADRMRRAVRGPGVAGGDAADTYIAERNGKRLVMADIPEHLRYTGTNDTLKFVGVRTITGQNLALFQRGETVLVKPIDDAEAAALPRRLSRQVRIENGRVSPVQGRSRGR